MIFKGSMTAVITPFKNGAIDESSLRKLVDWQISSGTDVIVPCGTTGEAVTLEPDEYERVIRICVEQTSGRILVLAGAGSNSTATAIKYAKQAKAAGANGILSVTPYYNKPTQEGLYQHFKAIAAAVDLPMVVYNVPGRTSVNMLAETTVRLSKIDTIVGVKEASGNLEQVRAIIDNASKDFAVVSGDDALNLKIYQLGGCGCISVTANVAPEKVSKVWDLFAEGNIDKAAEIHDSIADLNKVMFLETNPIPAKTALFFMGKCGNEFRLPLTPMSAPAKEELKAVLAKHNII